MSECKLRARYEEEMGREPVNLPDDHPDVWQWKYRGTREERETLLDRLAGAAESHDGQEALPL